MNGSIIIGLFQNITILLAFSMLYENFWLRKLETKSVQAKIITGLILGGICVLLIFTPWTLDQGIIFDTRSVMLSVSGLFFGSLPTIIAIIIASITRIYIGGDGVFMGIAVIVSSGAIGIAWRYLRPDWQNKKVYWELLALGAIVHVIMLACTLLLPSDKIINVIKLIIIPYFLIYTPSTMLLGLLLLQQKNNFQNTLLKEKLFETEQKLSQILKSSNIIAIILDASGNIIFCNQYLLDLTKYSRDEVISHNWFNLFLDKESREKIKNVLPKDHQTGTFSDYFENIIIAKNGHEFYVLWHNAQLQNTNNEIIGYTCIGVNITEQKNSELKLRNQIEKFSELNKDYITQNLELRKAKEKAEESDKLKTAFLANLSHEIRTPMNAILGFAELLKTPNLPLQKTEKYIEIIQNSGNHLLSIINDIVEISKIEAGQIDLNNSTVNLDLLIDQVYNTIKVTIPSDKDIELIVSKTDMANVSDITTDEVKLKQILINLINNAIKYTDKGSVIFGYKIINNETILFTVKDTGIGIDPVNHRLIFERFMQIENEVTRVKGGSGLGLAISKAYVEMMGGNIHLDSESGKGSTFTFTIPFISTNSNVKKQYMKEGTINRQETGNNEYILIAEDDDLNYILLEQILKEFNYNIVRAINGQNAVDICKNNPNIKIVLMDIKMPVMNGYDALKEIRNIKPEIKLIAQTAYALTDDIKKLKESNFDDFVTKPINRIELITKINAVLGK